MRVTLQTQAEVVDDFSSRNPWVQPMSNPRGVEAAKEAAGPLRKGLRVKLQGLEARPQLNHQAGQILCFCAAQSRWLVSLDNGTKKLVLSANLQPENHSQVTTAAVAGNLDVKVLELKGALPRESEPAGVNVDSDLPAAELLQDQLLASLKAARSQSLRHVEQLSGKTCQEVSYLRCEMQEMGRRHGDQLTNYCTMGKPTNHKEQCARNTVRKQLRAVAETTQPKIQRLLDASLEPKASLDAAKSEQLGTIDGIIERLTTLRRETSDIFGEYAAKVDVDRLAAESGIKSLTPTIEHVDKFMQCLAEEVRCEKMEADHLHRGLLDQLQKEEIVFVSANDSPSRSPRFALVQKDLAACKQLIEEQANREVSHTSLMQSWESMLKAMTAKKEPEPEPQWSGFWRRLGLGNRAAPSFD